MRNRLPDLLVHYFEVNFDEIAGALAQARGAGRSSPAGAIAAAELLRHVIRQLSAQARRDNRQALRPHVGWEAQTAEMIATLDGIHDAERTLLSRYLDLFLKSVSRTQASVSETIAEEAVEPVATPPGGPAALPLPLPEGPREVTLQPSGTVAETTPGAPATILQAVAQQALELMQVDASLVYTVAAGGKFILQAGVPTGSLSSSEIDGLVASGLLARAVQQNEVLSVEDLAAESTHSDERTWVDAGYHGFAAMALAPPLERPLGVLALLRRTPWRIDRRDALRLEELALEAVTALRTQSLAVKVEEVAVLHERLKLAREIHDGLASDLATVVALFKYYEQRREKDPQDAGQLLPQLRGMTEEVLQGARNILQSLRPKTIRSEGLVASVLKLVDQFGRTNLIETAANIRGEENGLTPEYKEGIFQVLREMLSNVSKHAQARSVSVSMDLSVSPWVLSVRDDGRGFDVIRVSEEAKRYGSYGLVGMRERARLLNGTLEISSRLGGGTQLTLIGPVQPSGHPV